MRTDPEKSERDDERVEVGSREDAEALLDAMYGDDASENGPSE